jgi:hypothetical protein
MAPASSSQAGSNGHLLSYDGGGAILFQLDIKWLGHLRNHAAFVYHMGDGAGPLLRY